MMALLFAVSSPSTTTTLVGWLVLGMVLCLAAIALAGADRFRAWWLGTDDPRSIAVFRIVFGVLLVCNINGMAEFFRFLYTDEGIFTADVARQVFASHQFAGFGDGMVPDEPWGFFDLGAFFRFLAGPSYSLLFFWDSPSFFAGYIVAFWLCAAAFIVGFRTRLAGVLTWLLMNGLLARNHLAWEGTELVFRCFLAYLVLARAGHAYSVDNWLRCRRLRREGRLSEPGKPGHGAGAPPSPEHPAGLEPVYRCIPVWPRRLLMLQLATIYFTTGCLKNGAVWMRGDALYYALNLDHFYRLPPQYLSSLFGTNLFRGMTWAVKIGQTAFPLVLVGLVTRFIAREGFPRLTGWRKWTARGGYFGLVGLSAAIAWVEWPARAALHRGWFCGLWVALWLLVGWAWFRLGHRPFVLRRRMGRPLAQPVVLDRVFVSKWLLGRRVFLIWHIAFHAHIFTLMNVGQFQTGMLSATFVFLEGREIATILRDIGHRLAQWRVPFVPTSVAAGAPILPAQAPELVRHHDCRVLPFAALLLITLGLVTGLLVPVVVQPAWDFRLVWLGVFALALTGVVLRELRHRAAEERPSKRPWAHGPIGRFLVTSLVLWHVGAVAVWLLPEVDSLAPIRTEGRKAVRTWLTVTTTDQGWGMFAPNPPRSNVFMKVLVTDAAGEVWDLRTDVYAPERKPIPWIWNTRLRKMNRRIIGGESGPSQWYRKWYARYECRQWALEHGGETPRKVELVKVWYRIPSPEQTRDLGYYVPEDLLLRSGAEKVEHVENCRTTVMGQLPDAVRARHGLPPLPPETPYRPWIKHKRRAWERQHIR